MAFIAHSLARLQPIAFGQGIFHDVDNGVKGAPLRAAKRCLGPQAAVIESNMTTGSLSKWRTGETVYPSSGIVHRIDSRDQMHRCLALARAWESKVRERAHSSGPGAKRCREMFLSDLFVHQGLGVT